ncbi:hypothetical protein NPIL_317261 [Nephila pilipes]|uniref:Secreted protein n=1 Tax=Nephila pilipes TaxID=299642 RepID=A0A8X6J5D6_NEPPI|nr:hypothetical protein NPIL_317261 [Nephila pilipes]
MFGVVGLVFIKSVLADNFFVDMEVNWQKVFGFGKPVSETGRNRTSRKSEQEGDFFSSCTDTENSVEAALWAEKVNFPFFSFSGRNFFSRKISLVLIKIGRRSHNERKFRSRLPDLDFDVCVLRFNGSSRFCFGTIEEKTKTLRKLPEGRGGN